MAASTLPVGVGLALADGSTLWLGDGVTTGGVGVLTGGVGVLKKQLFAALHGGEVGGEVGVGVGVGWLTTTVSVSPPQPATALLYVSPGKLALQ